MKERDLNEKQMRMYKNLLNEITAKMKHINTGSYQTRYRYLDSMKLFARVMVVAFHKNNLNRIRIKHVQYYADYMKNAGYSNASITTNLAGLRFYFDQTSNGRIYIPTNKELKVEPRSQAERININRAMPMRQYLELIEKANEEGREDYVLKLKLGFLLGLRVHEIIGIRKSKIRACLSYLNSINYDSSDSIGLEIKGKSGLIRFVDIYNDEQRKLLEQVLEYGKGRDDRLFTDGQAMHKVIKDFQKFISRNRKQDADYKVTAHSLRHSYAQYEYERILKETGDEVIAKQLVAESIGHGRHSITDIYITTIEDWNEIN